MPQITVTVKGAQIPVHVSDAGVFFTKYRGEALRDKTLEGLKTQLNTAVRNSGVSVPFTLVRGSEILHGTATGIHASSGMTLVRYATGETAQFRQYETGFLQPLSDDETRELTDLIETRDQAAQAVEDFQKERQLHLARTVREALSGTGDNDQS